MPQEKPSEESMRLAVRMVVASSLVAVAAWSWITITEAGSVATAGSHKIVPPNGTFSCAIVEPDGFEAMQSEFFRAVKSEDSRVGYGKASMSYFWFLFAMSFFMGLGKGGAPGSSTISMALNSLLAPDGCITFAIALVVPATATADVAVVVTRFKQTRWEVVWRLVPPTVFGVLLGSQLLGSVTGGSAKLMIGGALGAILLFKLAVAWSKGRAGGSDAPRPAGYADSIWFAWVIGILGGLATILTNSMGPLLNVFLLGLMPKNEFIATRASFFTVINFIKVVTQLHAGNLDRRLLAVSAFQGCAAIVGVLCATHVMKYVSDTTFLKLEYTLMTAAALRLIISGLIANGMIANFSFL
eukprot:m.446879 g.446879  ORF g.446879 m.446879 type:complete len:356 (-) comp19435_c0_seq1:276-1343(-)